MWLPPRVLARLFVATAAFLTVIAITLGRSGTRHSDERRMVHPRLQPINMHLFHPHHDDMLMLDVDTGKAVHFALPDANLIKFASCAPWQDRRGGTQLVGLWMGQSRRDQTLSIGLTRFGLPGKEMLDRIEMDVLPASPPCWFPGTSARILFAGTDGRLYRFSFEENHGLDPAASDTRRPLPLTWQTHPPVGLIGVSAPTSPADPRIRGKLIVSLTFAAAGQPTQPGVSLATQAQLWWLQLSRDGSAIIAAGPLISKEAASSPDRTIVEDLPVISTLSDGRLLLAYLACGESERNYRLRLAPITTEGPSNVPSVDEATAAELSDNVLLSPPAFSGDGRWIYAIPRPAHDPIRIERFSIADALNKKPAQAVVTVTPAAPTMLCVALDRDGDSFRTPPERALQAQELRGEVLTPAADTRQLKSTAGGQSLGGRPSPMRATADTLQSGCEQGAEAS